MHDAVEDTPVTADDITRLFGEQVAHIVEGVTKIDKIQFANSEDHQAENVRKMLLAMVTDVRVVHHQAGRPAAQHAHAASTCASERQQAIAQETLDIYAPLAHRLGMGKLRGELEDLAFRYVDPVSFEKVQTAIDERRAAKAKPSSKRSSGRSQDKLKRAQASRRASSGASSASTASSRSCRTQRSSVDQVYDLLRGPRHHQDACRTATPSSA